MFQVRMRTLAAFLGLLLAARGAAAQHYLEARGADTKYRFLDWNYTFKNAVVLDLFYVGVPGSNEANLGGGYAIRIGSNLTVTPLVYAVLGKELGQRGIKAALLVGFERKGWKVNSFLAHFSPVSGMVEPYQVLDSLDICKTLGRRLEIGLSNGFFHAEGKWNPQVGPMAKWNDRLGSWALSYRLGPEKELRIVRSFLFGR